MSVRSPRSELLRIPWALNLLLLATALSLAATLLWTASRAETWYGLLLSALAFSYINNTLFSLLHEAVHGSFHPRPRVNEWCGRVAAVFFPTSLTMQRRFHLGHHSRNRSEVEQFDYIRSGDNRLLKYVQWYGILTGVYWLSIPLGCTVFLLCPWILRLPVLRSRESQLGRQTSTNVMIADLDKAPGWLIRCEILSCIAAQMVLFVALDLTWTGWICCYALFAINWSSLQYADHAWSDLDVRDGAWNLKVNRIIQWLFLNYHHHLAHHQHPDVPWLHLHRFVDFQAPRPRFLGIYLRMWLGPRPYPEPAAESKRTAA